MTTLLTDNIRTLPNTTHNSTLQKYQGNLRSQNKPTVETEVSQENLISESNRELSSSSCFHRFWYKYFIFPEIETILTDFQIIFERDPAARNWIEVLCCYPGLHALLLYRLAHKLHYHKIPLIPRLISHFGRFFTGIEIHPGAQIGQGVFIDHGMGVVIGETAIVGDYSLIYQGVTLGGTGKEIGKRHPTIGTNVVVGAGAKVLGNINIGNNVRIGAGSIVLRHVPSDCTVVGIPGRVVSKSSERTEVLDHGKFPDTEATATRALVEKIQQLEEKLQTLIGETRKNNNV
ncbi:serine O-acetyltransferase [Trichodesmium erythraeum IMS101]|uniref:Serine acetyltransferase n=1 Tax=Trichodesmium erythraeum (strain IMS101) TaxID=203124 RepID=Q10X84_TRIEI|nr:serine O-acetyltransferase [Trichodesmium erythraeum GBRTRLIN201]